MAYIRYLSAAEAGPRLSTLNRLADGLGVELEEGWTKEDCTLTREEFDVLREARRRKREVGWGA